MSASNPAAADFSERLDTAVRLLCEGQSESYIAAQLGVSVPLVKKWLRMAYRAKKEEREEAIERHRLQLHYLHQRFLSQFTHVDEKTGKQSQLRLSDRDVKTLLAIQEREARLLGLDAPAKAEFTHEFANATNEELVQQARRLGIDTAALEALPSGEVIDGEIVIESDATTEVLKDAN